MYSPASKKGEAHSAKPKALPMPPALSSASKKTGNKNKMTASRTIEFNVDAFLKQNMDWYDDKDLEEDYEDSEDKFEDTGDDGEQNMKHKKRYKLDCFTPVDLALFRASRQIYSESWPIFYKERTFVFDSGGHDAIRFLNTLPIHIFTSIASIGLTGYIFMCDDSGSRVAWSGNECQPKYVKDGLQLNTPFASLLATKMRS